ncbi:MAG: DUF1987 domain-containing protein [Deltaproteobacteria bacterium]|jgi:hypothetical protein|nr:DUF1987 domain-containing protein [Deltaproteobacteria bacterium]
MNNLVIEPTKYTPNIVFLFDEKVLEISGESYPENTAEFYSPVLKWLIEFLKIKESKTITVNIIIQYFNSSSSKIFMDIFDLLNEKSREGFDIIVNWNYLEADDNMLEYGEEFQEDVDYLKFNLVPRKSI